MVDTPLLEWFAHQNGTDYSWKASSVKQNHCLGMSSWVENGEDNKYLPFWPKRDLQGNLPNYWCDRHLMSQKVPTVWQTGSLTRFNLFSTPVSRNIYYHCNNHVCFCVEAWASCHKRSHLKCLITEGWAGGQDNCLLFMLLLCVVTQLETWYCG